MKLRRIIISFLILIGIAVSPKIFSQSTTSYTVENYSIVGKNTDRYNNMPLYINNTNAFILTGDQPIARLAKDQFMYGTFMAGIERIGKAKWLQNFAYRINIDWWVFALAGFLALLIAFLTVSWQSYKAASINPVEALRYE
jgi:ABC-type antimicrobial peptide transport system permease subunit